MTDIKNELYDLLKEHNVAPKEFAKIFNSIDEQQATIDSLRSQLEKK